jgi:hypothetical protein
MRVNLYNRQIILPKSRKTCDIGLGPSSGLLRPNNFKWPLTPPNTQETLSNRKHTITAQYVISVLENIGIKLS